MAASKFCFACVAHTCGLPYISFGQCQGSTQQMLKNVQLLFLGISHCEQKKYWFDMPLYGPVVTLTTLKKRQQPHCVTIIDGEIESFIWLGGKTCPEFCSVIGMLLV